MQSALLASSLVVLTAGASIPKPLNYAQVVKDSMKSVRVAGKMSAESVDAQLKAEGINMRTTHFNDPGNYFEVAYFKDGDCYSGKVTDLQGWQTGRCVNAVDNFYELDGVGTTASMILSEPKNGGFPFITYFDKHGCVPDNAFTTFRMNKVRDLDNRGFSKDYRVGQCEPFYGDVLDNDRPEPLFVGQATWSDKRHEPQYNAVVSAWDTKHKSCMKEKYFQYMFLAADPDVCIQDDENTWVTYNVDMCDQGKAMRRSYHDMQCTNEKTEDSPEELMAEKCLFDSDDFIDHFEDKSKDGGISFFQFSTKDCYKKHDNLIA